MFISTFLISEGLFYFQKLFAQYFLFVPGEFICGLIQSETQFLISLIQNFAHNFMESFKLD